MRPTTPLRSPSSASLLERVITWHEDPNEFTNADYWRMRRSSSSTAFPLLGPSPDDGSYDHRPGSSMSPVRRSAFRSAFERRPDTGVALNDISRWADINIPRTGNVYHRDGLVEASPRSSNPFPTRVAAHPKDALYRSSSRLGTNRRPQRILGSSDSHRRPGAPSLDDSWRVQGGELGQELASIVRPPALVDPRKAFSHPLTMGPAPRMPTNDPRRAAVTVDACSWGPYESFARAA